MKYNLLVKRLKGREYIITDFIATKLSEKECNILIRDNEILKDFTFMKYSDSDFSWWSKIDKYLTRNKLYYNQYFNIDFNGNVSRY